jgi:hypothetical protein
MNLLREFAKDFTKSTGIKVDMYEDKTFPHWKRLLINKNELDCEQMNAISMFIIKRFSQPRLYSHLLVKLHITFRGQLCITADVKELERVYNK